jgi:hypothetical protein
MLICEFLVPVRLGCLVRPGLHRKAVCAKGRTAGNGRPAYQVSRHINVAGFDEPIPIRRPSLNPTPEKTLGNPPILAFATQKKRPRFPEDAALVVVASVCDRRRR